MSQESRAILKAYFETGDYPTEAEFIDLIDSCLNLVDDSLGVGDMTKAVYDQDDSGVVDDSELVNGDTVANDSAVQANTAKDTNVSTNLSLGAIDGTTMIIISSDGTNVTLIAATTDDAGLLTAAKFDEIVANNAKVSYGDNGNVVLLTGNQTVAGEKTFSDNLKGDAQAHGGDTLESFSASKTFDADDGNVQEMPVTSSTTIGITNEEAGVYIFRLEIDSGGSPTITIGASFGTVMDNSADLINADNDINILTLTVWPSGAKEYSINTVTA